MKRGRLALFVWSTVFIGATMASLRSQPAQPMAAGAYTAAQAQAGQAAYAQSCAGCHLPDFRGSGDAPAVAWPDFIAKWGPRAVNELFTYLVQSMPPTAPGSLGEAGTLADGVPAADQRSACWATAAEAYLWQRR
jgi:mono/diheme cytochrome c family protein